MITLALIITVLVILYLYGIRNYDYWKSRGITYEKPIPFFGNALRGLLMLTSTTERTLEVYRKYPKEKVVGMFRASHPVLLIRDPGIAKQVLVTDFADFYMREFSLKNSPQMLLRNVVTAEGDLWRLLRQFVTPAFTTSKLKIIFPVIVESAGRLQERLHQSIATRNVIDACDSMSRYTIDFIGACAFGFDADNLQDKNSAFKQFVDKTFQTHFWATIFRFLIDIFPMALKLKYLNSSENFFFRLVEETLRQRNYQPSKKPDFINFLLERKQKGKLICESLERTKPDGTPEVASLEVDNKLIAAQMFMFFVAGFETSSTAMAIILHELAHHPEVQNKIQKEIDSVLAKHNNKITYDAIQEMCYLECAFKESIRLFPPVGFLMRSCVQKHTFEELGLTIDEGVRVIISLQALHNDPQYFDNPDEFRPDRFASNASDINNKHVFMPFGEGPRACVGSRLGQLQSMAGMAAVLSRFSVRPAPGAPRRPVRDPSSHIVQNFVGGLPLIFESRAL